MLYAPTWRGSLGSLEETSTVDVLSVMQQLATLDCVPLYRGHALTSPAGTAGFLDEWAVPDDIPTNDLLAVVDVLITDYSSIFFDFMATGRPIVYFAYDLNEYSSERGLYFDLESLPGRVCAETAGLLTEVSAALHEEGSPDEKYVRGMETFCAMEDGSSARRAVDFFFFDATEFVAPPESDPKHKVLFYQGSFIPNGITTSYLNLVGNLDAAGTRMFLAVEPASVKSEERRLEKFAQHPEHVQVLGRVGTQLVTAEERWVIDKFNLTGDLASPELWDIYDGAFNGNSGDCSVTRPLIQWSASKDMRGTGPRCSQTRQARLPGSPSTCITTCTSNGATVSATWNQCSGSTRCTTSSYP